jgi:DNA-directed RNA polymerase subunit RPC12/RpoP
MAADEITCPMCGFKNPTNQERCRSCGAKVEILTANYTAEEEHARRYQQEDFEWKWALIGAGMFTVLQALILGLVPKIIGSFDPQGLPGLMLSVPVFFVGGIALGIISPGKTFVEPAVGAMIAAIPTLGIVSLRTPEGFDATLLAYIVCAIMGVMTALFGAFVGEKWQMSTAKSHPKPKSR